MQWDCRLSQGSPLGSWLCQLWSRKEDLQRAWNRDRRAMWDQVRLSYCRHDGLLTVRDEARLIWDHNHQSHWGPQCSKTTLIGESGFHTCTPLGIEPTSLMTESTGGPLDQRNCIWMQWDCRLSTLSFIVPVIKAFTFCFIFYSVWQQCNVLNWKKSWFSSLEKILNELSVWKNFFLSTAENSQRLRKQNTFCKTWPGMPHLCLIIKMRQFFYIKIILFLVTHIEM
jgi:hypothetical protein